MRSRHLKKLYYEIGDSIHAMNTIAVALDIMPEENINVSQDLRISWEPQNINYSKKITRSYAERSAMVYACESFYEYLTQISKDDFWEYPHINFEGEEQKSDKVYNFLSNIPHIEPYLPILSELLCHWRNKIVHTKSHAKLNAKKIQYLIKNKEDIYNNIHHFDVEEALDNFEKRKITLKDSSTLITLALKSAEIVDKLYLKGIEKIVDLEKIISIFKQQKNFLRTSNEPNLSLRKKKMKLWILTNYPYFEENKIEEICEY